jgi:hypothetical protein
LRTGPTLQSLGQRPNILSGYLLFGRAGFFWMTQDDDGSPHLLGKTNDLRIYPVPAAPGRALIRQEANRPANDTAIATADAVATAGNVTCLTHIPTSAHTKTPVKIASRRRNDMASDSPADTPIMMTAHVTGDSPPPSQPSHTSRLATFEIVATLTQPR